MSKMSAKGNGAYAPGSTGYIVRAPVGVAILEYSLIASPPPIPPQRLGFVLL